MAISKEIATVSIPKGEFENDYTFFEDGKIRHNYDQHANKLDLEEWLSPGNISDAEKEKIIKACPLQYKARIPAILRR